MFALIPVGMLLIRWFNANIPEELWGWGLYWYPFILVIPGLCVFVAMVASWIDRFAAGSAVLKALAYIGGFSFEFFLFHNTVSYGGTWFYISRTILRMTILHLLSLPVRKAMLAVDRHYRAKKA